MLEVKGLSSGYGRENIVNDISFCLEDGKCIGIVGPNGSGKSTLLKSIINELDYSGECFIDGEAIKNIPDRSLARKMSYVPQKSGIGIDISVLEVVLMGFNPRLKLFERPSKEDIEKAKAIIDEVGLAGLYEKNYLELSEGQKQLAIIARALCSDAGLLIMDEPENALDINVRYKTMKLIKEHTVKEGRLLLMTLHDLSIALNMCDRLLLIKEGLLIDTIDTGLLDALSMQEKLSKLFGEVTVTRLADSDNREQLVMIKNMRD